jgi:hypothetical protein
VWALPEIATFPSSLASSCRRRSRPNSGFDSIDGIRSLAEGADQIFAEQVLKAGGALTAVVPSAHYTRSFETLADVVGFAGERGVPTTVVWPPGSRRG